MKKDRFGRTGHTQPYLVNILQIVITKDSIMKLIKPGMPSHHKQKITNRLGTFSRQVSKKDLRLLKCLTFDQLLVVGPDLSLTSGN